jgi:hypothetical protein
VVDVVGLVVPVGCVLVVVVVEVVVVVGVTVGGLGEPATMTVPVG